MYKLMNGKETRDNWLEENKVRVEELIKKGHKPHMVVVQVGADPASTIYIRNKKRACEKIGVKFTKISLESSVSEQQLLDEVVKLNNDEKVTGYLVQFPLPDHISKTKVIETIDINKDVDALDLPDVAFTDGSKIMPCTPKGVMRMASVYNVDIKGKEVVVLGRSKIAGEPAAKMMRAAGGNVNVIHRSVTPENRRTWLAEADIIVTATGVVDPFRPEEVKKGVVIFDIGILRVDGKLRGDIDYKEYEEIASLITPVPGGLGPMTIGSLVDNLVELELRRK